MKSKRILWVVSAVLVLMLLVGCAPDNSKFPTGRFYKGSDKIEGFQFNPDGTWFAFYNDDHDAEGTYQVDGDIYTETSNNVAGDDAGCKASSKYKWSFDGKNLRFSLIEDSCINRRSAYTDWIYTIDK